MSERELGRAIKQTSSAEAYASRAITRGVVDQVLAGSVVVQLSGGAKVEMECNLKVAKGVAISLLKRGNFYEPFEVSVWQGGTGAPFPEP